MKKYDVYVINLDERTDRWDHIQKEFGEYEFLNLIRFPAISHEIPWIGATLSHIKIAELAKEKNLDYVIVMEDDNAIFNKDEINFETKFLETINFLKQQIDKWKIFKFSCTYVNKDANKGAIKAINEDIGIYQLNVSQAANFLIYNQTSYDAIIAHKNNINSMEPDIIDIFLNTISPSWVLHPNITYQYANHSDLLYCFMDYTQAFADVNNDLLQL